MPKGPDAVVPRLGEPSAPRRSSAVRGSSPVGRRRPRPVRPGGRPTRFLVNLPGAWPGVPVAGPVGAALGLPTTLINDARAFGLAELRLGAARGARSMIGLTLGTGVGGVIAIDGRVHLGHDGTGGELGHQTLEPDGPACGCGNRGCLEAFARADRIAAACGTATAEEAMAAARAGDPAAVAGLRRRRALPRDRHRQHDRGRQSGRGRHRRRHRGGVRPAARPDRGRAARAGRTRRRSIASEVVPAELGTWAGAIGAAVHGAETATGRPGGRPRSGRRTMIQASTTPQPQYRQIEQALRERIATLRPGARLPSDAELCAEFGVSRMTARNAMQRLAEDGLIAREARPRQLRGRASRAPAGQSADDVHARRCAAPGAFPARAC